MAEGRAVFGAAAPSCEACAAEGWNRPADEFDALCADHRRAYDADPDEADRIQGLVFGAICEGDDDPRCRYCGADCSNGRSWDGGDLYACGPCSDARAAANRASRDARGGTGALWARPE
jgi:hypothetical protein